MKVLLYTEWLKYISNSGVGRAIKHQMKALEENNIQYTTNCNDDFNIVHINTIGPKSYLLAKRCSKQGIKVIIHAHSTEEDFKNSFIGSNLVSKLFKSWLIKVYNLADQIITPTPYSKEILVGYGLNPNIECVSNGIELEYFKNDEELGKKFRQKYGFSINDKIITAVGLPIERKGILDFIELAKRLPNYKFVWCGDINSLYLPGKVKKVLKNLPSNVYRLGYVQRDMMRGVYAGSNIFVTMSYEETEGIVVLEAIATKRQVIVRDIGAYKGWLQDGDNCHMARNLNEFEGKINKLFNKELEDLSEKGYEVVKERDIKKIGKKLASIYQKTLNK
ncbi:MAG TPA: glycosyl transferase family 1 [Clostridiales bacterium]|nr:MAG: glycosyl transferase family 1 [Clostridiales bacterium GWD2_32_19]HCC07205.1 glycosyl transferase family 1 [Clostridiales bacterium]